MGVYRIAFLTFSHHSSVYIDTFLNNSLFPSYLSLSVFCSISFKEHFLESQETWSPSNSANIGKLNLEYLTTLGAKVFKMELILPAS